MMLDYDLAILNVNDEKKTHQPPSFFAGKAA